MEGAASLTFKIKHLYGGGGCQGKRASLIIKLEDNLKEDMQFFYIYIFQWKLALFLDMWIGLLRFSNHTLVSIVCLAMHHDLISFTI